MLIVFEICFLSICLSFCLSSNIYYLMIYILSQYSLSNEFLKLFNHCAYSAFPSRYMVALVDTRTLEKHAQQVYFMVLFDMYECSASVHVYR